jgi:MFS family permease
MFDPAAVIPMLLIGAYMSVQSLFVIFAPVYARASGIPIEQLGIYYPLYGSVVLVAHLTLGRVSDRVGRWPSIATGCVIAVFGLTIAALVPGIVGLLVAGGL